MTIGKACAIFLNIDSPDYSPAEKGTAIKMVSDMPTHNGVTKDSMLRVIRWLWKWIFSTNSAISTVADLIAVMPPEDLAVLIANISRGTCVPEYGQDHSKDCPGASGCTACFLNWLRQWAPTDPNVDWTK